MPTGSRSRAPASSTAQSVRTTEAGGPRGYDAGKQINGRKRHLVTDTQGLPLARSIPPTSRIATLQDRLKELALAGITTVAAANRFLREIYLPEHNARFAAPLNAIADRPRCFWLRGNPPIGPELQVLWL